MEYIPVRGQKEYCEKIRELSGALDKDYQVTLKNVTVPSKIVDEYLL